MYIQRQHNYAYLDPLKNGEGGRGRDGKGEEGGRESQNGD